MVWSVFMGVLFGLVFEEGMERHVWCGFVFGVLVKVVEVVGSEKTVQKKQQRVESSCALRETQAS